MKTISTIQVQSSAHTVKSLFSFFAMHFAVFTHPIMFMFESFIVSLTIYNISESCLGLDQNIQLPLHTTSSNNVKIYQLKIADPNLVQAISSVRLSKHTVWNIYQTLSEDKVKFVVYIPAKTSKMLEFILKNNTFKNILRKHFITIIRKDGTKASD